jgi:TonB-linked SusC/RagA family outer membrane protein
MKNKLLRFIIMISNLTLKVAIVQTLFMTMALGYDGIAQENVSVKQVTINIGFKNADLSDVLKTIEKETGYRFIYDAKDVTNSSGFTVNAKKRTVADLLIELSKAYDLQFKQVNNSISIKKKNAIDTKEEVPIQIIIDGFEISGKVVSDSDNEGLPGVNIVIQGTTQGTVTDINGNYVLTVPSNESVLVFSSVGYISEEVTVGDRTIIDMSLAEDITALEEIVVIGYGEMKKESVVGAITQTTGEELMQSGGVSTVGQALTGRLPGVITINTTGRPGDETPEIYIRGQSTWNGGGQPLILVDGIERTMNDIDLGDVESISVLKDASATAVFGVKGANGVILITTKRGKEGKTQLSITANSTFKTPAKLPGKLNSYDALQQMNAAIERTIPYRDEGWVDYMPMDILDKYRNPANEYERQLYPDVDWTDAALKDFAMDHRVNLSVRGGTEFAKYFGAISYQHVGDIFDGAQINNNRTYNADFSYNRFNYRSNIDFDITKTTRISVNLSGYYGIQNDNEGDKRLVYSAVYNMAPSIFYPIYDDGTYGRTPTQIWDLTNPAVILSAKGATQNHRVQVNSDFILEQKLDFLLEGLKFRGSVSYDNNFRATKGISEAANTPGGENVIYKIYNPDGSEQVIEPPPINQFSGVINPWVRDPLSMENWNTSRRLFYQLSLTYDRQFAAKHNVSVLALMNREQYAIGNMFPRYREDWVGRVTYNYDERYFLDVNGAYNGSEKFGPGYKFELFPSVALGWMLTNEDFFRVSWLDRLKVRGSYGIVGDDYGGQRWAYIDQWEASNSRAWMNNINPHWDQPRPEFSPYTFYRELVIGNPDLRWETSTKTNIGLDMALFNELITFEGDFFYETRDDIIVSGADRSVPSFLGFDPADFNIGKTEVSGFELTLGAQDYINPDLKLWGNVAYTMAKDKILYKEDPELREPHLKDEGYPIGLQKLGIPDGIMTSWDDVYSSVAFENSQEAIRPGYYGQVDFNGDGIINSNDNVPWGYPLRPQNTWNLTAGVDYKNFSFMVQFYGAYNAIKQYVDRTFTSNTAIYYDFLTDYWTPDNLDGTDVLTSWKGQGHNDPQRDWYDASYVKLKNIEAAYTLRSNGGTSYRFFINGNDLFTWSHLPDDRQANAGTGETSFRGDYPTFRRLNIGLTVNF